MEEKKYIFPEYFSVNAKKLILLNGKPQNRHVYRVAKYGRDTTTAFLNYYDEVVLGLKTVRNKQKYLEKCKEEIDRLSISCYYDIKDIIYYYEITLKDSYPERILLESETNYKYGLSQVTSERKKESTDSHVDWWLFKDATPWLIFNEVKVYE